MNGVPLLVWVTVALLLLVWVWVLIRWMPRASECRDAPTALRALGVSLLLTLAWVLASGLTLLTVLLGSPS